MCRLPVLLLLLAAFSPNAHAGGANGLYRAEAIVTGTEEPERTRGFRSGLTDVIVKLTGDARLAGSARIAPLLEKPHQYVAAFEYEDRMKDIPVHDEQGTRERPHFLRMQFKPELIDGALRDLGLTKWGPDRPALAVWLGVKTAVNEFVLTAGGDGGYGQRAVLLETAERRGLPVLLPVSDEATGGVGVTDIAEQNLPAMKSASPDADAWLSGILSITERGYWNLSWRLDWMGRTRVWTKAEVSFDAAIKDGLDTAALIFSGNQAM